MLSTLFSTYSPAAHRFQPVHDVRLVWAPALQAARTA